MVKPQCEGEKVLLRGRCTAQAVSDQPTWMQSRKFFAITVTDAPESISHHKALSRASRWSGDFRGRTVGLLAARNTATVTRTTFHNYCYGCTTTTPTPLPLWQMTTPCCFDFSDDLQHHSKTSTTTIRTTATTNNHNDNHNSNRNNNIQRQPHYQGRTQEHEKSAAVDCFFDFKFQTQRHCQRISLFCEQKPSLIGQATLQKTNPHSGLPFFADGLWFHGFLIVMQKQLTLHQQLLAPLAAFSPKMSKMSCSKQTDLPMHCSKGIFPVLLNGFLPTQRPCKKLSSFRAPPLQQQFFF